jgi:hypothetical protein
MSIPDGYSPQADHDIGWGFVGRLPLSWGFNIPYVRLSSGAPRALRGLLGRVRDGDEGLCLILAEQGDQGTTRPGSLWLDTLLRALEPSRVASEQGSTGIERCLTRPE